MSRLGRRRWSFLLLMLLLLGIVVFNMLAFFTMPSSQSGRVDEFLASREDMSHLQVIRKRLNKSANNSSNISYNQEVHEAKLASLDRADVEEDNLAKEVRGYDLKRPLSSETNDVLSIGNLASDRKATQGIGSRANYSLPEVDSFVKSFRAQFSSDIPVHLDNTTDYSEFLKQINSKRQKGSRLKTYINNKGTKTWERFHYNIRQFALYDPQDIYLDKLLSDMATKEIVDVEQKEGGTQIKLLLTFEDDGQALFKPMRFPRDQETLPDHFYFADYERHNAEIAAFHLDRILGFHRVPPTVGRKVNVSSDIHRLANSKLAKTFFISPAGNMCFHGSCSYYCDSSHPICGHPMMLEGSLAAFLPPLSMAKRKTWRNPWKRSYSKHRKAYWEVYNDLCYKVKLKHPYNEGRRLLDILDMSVFDFLTGNLDRHHYETFREFGNNTFLLHMDNGRAFGKSKYDCISCLAPVRQCCMIRMSTLVKLVKLYVGPQSLSQVMRQSFRKDPLDPILWEPHLDALDRRLSKILHVINGCLEEGRMWEEVVIDDSVT